jgi:hypothetical protein
VPRVTTSDLSGHASASMTLACRSCDGVTSGCPCTDNNRGKSVVHTDSYEAVTRASEPPVIGALAG